MQHYYYLNTKNKKDGPHDMVTIMRRVRSGIILPDTLFYIGEEQTAAAHSIEDIAHFFNRPVEDIRQELSTRPALSLSRIFNRGWEFTTDHQSMTVFAGCILLLAAMVGMIVNEISHSLYSAFTASWIVFLLLQNCFLAVSLRLYRGQRADLDFIEHSLAPITGKLSLVSVVFASMVMVGLVLLAVPGIVMLAICFYMPMFILDYNYGIRKTVGMILSMLRKMSFASMLNLGILIFIYIVSVVLIFPIPVMLPLIAGSLCAVYEELSS